MPVSSRRITPDDLLPDADYARERKARRAALLPTKRLRRVSLGPYYTLIFETYDTMLFQIQEMLLVEHGGAAQVQAELEAYNPLIPQGQELVATVMFEIDDPVRRASLLGQWGGIEEHFYIQVDMERRYAVPEGDVDRTRDGKTSAVHFLRFPLTEDGAAAFGDYERPVMIGCDHPLYGHIAVLAEDVRSELARDLE